MILVKIRKYAKIEGVEHIATSWTIASDRDMKNIIEHKERTSMLELLFSTVEVPKDVTYYVLARRHFNQSHMDYDLEIIEVQNTDQAYDNMLYQGRARIETPIPVIDEKELLDTDDGTLSFKTTAFRSDFDKHKATHYFILDDNNEIIFSKLNETINLDNLEIENKYIYRNKNKVTFACAHIGASGIESKIGKRTFYFNRDINWEFDTNITSIIPNQDFTLGFRSIDGKPINIMEVEVKTPNTNETILYFKKTPITNITIPWNLLPEDVTYNLKVIYVANGQAISVTRKLKTSSYNNLIIRDEDYIYKNRLEYQMVTEYYLPNYIHTESMYNGNILVPKATRYLDIYRWDNKKKDLLKTTSQAKGMRLTGDELKGAYIKPLSRAIILIDHLNAKKQPTFLVYRYNLGPDDFTLLNTKVRTDEEYPVGINGAVVCTDINSIWYIPYGRNVLRRYNIYSNTIDTITEIPVSNMKHGLVIRSRNNRMLLCNGENFEAYMYNTGTGKMSEGYQFRPDTYINKPVKAVPLINGSTLLHLLPDKDIDMSRGAYEYFNYETGSFVVSNNQFENTTSVPSTSIVTITGEVLLTNTIAREDLETGKQSHDTQFYIYR